MLRYLFGLSPSFFIEGRLSLSAYEARSCCLYFREVLGSWIPSGSSYPRNVPAGMSLHVGEEYLERISRALGYSSVVGTTVGDELRISLENTEYVM